MMETLLSQLITQKREFCAFHGTWMIEAERLAASGFLKFDNDRRVGLTEQGIQIAKVMRRIGAAKNNFAGIFDPVQEAKVDD